jgi:dienelactone hydrolase
MTSATDGVECVPVRIETGSATIEGERCDPVGSPDASFPAALVLSGCGGYESDADLTSSTVRALAERGVVGMRVDWLGAEPAPPDTYCEAGAVIGAANPLLQGVVDAVAHLRADPSIDPDRVGTAAYSLGAIAVMAAEFGGAGLTEVAPLELRAAALLSYPNQLPTISALAAERGVPPLFLMTGSEDVTAPPRDSRILARAAREGGSTAEVVVVEGQDHPWRGDAAVRAGDVLADFLAATLVAT